MKKRYVVLIGVVIVLILAVVYWQTGGNLEPEDSSCELENDCFLRYVGEGSCASCDPSDEDWICLNREELEDYKYPWEKSENTGIACAECIPDVDKMVTCVCSEGNCKKEIVNENDCVFFYTGYSENNPCGGCSYGQEEYICLSSEEADEEYQKYLEEFGDNLLDALCSPCPDPDFDRHECKYIGDKCVKVLIDDFRCESERDCKVVNCQCYNNDVEVLTDYSDLEISTCEEVLCSCVDGECVIGDPSYE